MAHSTGDVLTKMRISQELNHSSANATVLENSVFRQNLDMAGLDLCCLN